MNDESAASCTKGGSENVDRIRNAMIRTGGITPDVGPGTRTA